MGGITAASGGRHPDNTDLLSLQARMKKDPPGYEEELILQLRHFDACTAVLLLQRAGHASAAAPGGESGPAKEVADMAMFLAHMAPFYPQHLGHIPQKLMTVLAKFHTLQPYLRRQLTQSLILLRNRKKVELREILPLLMDLQCIGDRPLRKLAFLHIVHDIRRTNLKHRNEQFNRTLQNYLFTMLKAEDEVKAKRALILLAELHRRKVWNDDRTANAICMACLHTSSRIMIASLRFLLGYDQEKEDRDDDESSDDEEEDSSKPLVSVDRETIYKAYHKGTSASKKKKQAKLQRVMRSLKKQQKHQLREMEQGSHAPLQHLQDPHEFAESLFSRLRSSTEKFEVKLMMMQVISRTIGIHRLILLNFYPFLQRYVEPHQRDVTLVLASLVQACHDLVPPDAIEAVLRQLVNHFVHDRARPEVIAVGLNAVREICMRVPLIMTSDLLQDLALYKKSREKAVAAAARSVIAVYRELMPSMLAKKDRGRNADLAAKPKAYGEVAVVTGVPGAELLLEDGGSDDSGDDDGDENLQDDEDEDVEPTNEEGIGEDDGSSESDGNDGSEDEDLDDFEGEGEDNEKEEVDDADEERGVEVGGEDGEEINNVDETEPVEEELASRKRRKIEVVEGGVESSGPPQTPETPRTTDASGISELNAATPGSSQSLRTLRKLAAAKSLDPSDVKSKDGDGILSNEDFQRIRTMKAKKTTKEALKEHGLTKAGVKRKEAPFKLKHLESLSERRLNPAVLEAHIKRRAEKEERVAAAKAGREDRTPYSSRAATKQKKTGGTSNKQKDKRKKLPLAAVRSKVARTAERKRTKGRGGNQFRGKKAWKS